MLVAVLSDIHSNVYALRAVLDDVERAGVSEVWVCGDTFGYYPWAARTFRLLRARRPLAVLGNHDQWVADPDSVPGTIAGEIARHNARELAGAQPAALAWLSGLPPIRTFNRGSWTITMTHGTPDDQLGGRYYPDDERQHRWLPGPGKILILGQTHYPLLRGDAPHGLVLNPGSVGQPRDGDPMPSWALLDLVAGAAELRRAVYDNAAAMARLSALHWDERVIRGLDKR